MQLVQCNTEILLEHREPSSAEISLHFLTQSTWKAVSKEKGRYQALPLSLSDWLQPLPSPASCPVACSTSRPGCGYKQPGCCGTTRHTNLPAQSPVNAETNSISSVPDHSSSYAIKGVWGKIPCRSFCALFKGSSFLQMSADQCYPLWITDEAVGIALLLHGQVGEVGPAPLACPLPHAAMVSLTAVLRASLDRLTSLPRGRLAVSMLSIDLLCSSEGASIFTS